MLLPSCTPVGIPTCASNCGAVASCRENPFALHTLIIADPRYRAMRFFLALHKKVLKSSMDL